MNLGMLLGWRIYLTVFRIKCIVLCAKQEKGGMWIAPKGMIYMESIIYMVKGVKNFDEENLSICDGLYSFFV